MTLRDCYKQNCKNKYGNCLIPGSDGLPVQCVGSWVEDKYFFLERYLNASCEARRMFADKGNAVFIDLFAGPGRCIVRYEQREIDSGGIMALNRDEAPFNEYFYFDISETNVAALEKRIDRKSNHYIKCGDSNILINKLLKELLQQCYRYHFAFVDPFVPEGLKFNTLRELAKLGRMDMLIHFPIGAIKRNLKTWTKHTNTILDDFKEQLKSIGYPEKGLKMVSSDKDIYTGLPTVPVKNIKEVDLYVLILASKHEL